ncbi:hypothetical protein [Duffyella gerundensis]|uniref:hypothetical protein n=1 Tax=Duffyella TaxID=3026546 RepID=UPI003F6E3F54
MADEEAFHAARVHQARPAGHYFSNARKRIMPAFQLMATGYWACVKIILHWLILYYLYFSISCIVFKGI